MKPLLKYHISTPIAIKNSELYFHKSDYFSYENIKGVDFLISETENIFLASSSKCHFDNINTVIGVALTPIEVDLFKDYILENHYIINDYNRDISFNVDAVDGNLQFSPNNYSYEVKKGEKTLYYYAIKFNDWETVVYTNKCIMRDKNISLTLISSTNNDYINSQLPQINFSFINLDLTEFVSAPRTYIVPTDQTLIYLENVN